MKNDDDFLNEIISDRTRKNANFPNLVVEASASKRARQWLDQRGIVLERSPKPCLECGIRPLTDADLQSLTALISKAPASSRLIALLQTLECSGTDRDGDACCPLCGGAAFPGEESWADHRPACELAAVLHQLLTGAFI